MNSELTAKISQRILFRNSSELSSLHLKKLTEINSPLAIALGVDMRSMSSMTPKPTSKKTKSRLFVFPSMPRPKIGPASSEVKPTSAALIKRQKAKNMLNPTYNYVLKANKELSKRERHFRKLLVSSQCAWIPQNPDVEYFVPPYWLDNGLGQILKFLEKIDEIKKLIVDINPRKTSSLDGKYDMGNKVDENRVSVGESRERVHSTEFYHDLVKRNLLGHNSNQSEQTTGQVSLSELNVFLGPLDPFTQSTSHPRLHRAFVASTAKDKGFAEQLLNARVIIPDDLEQVKQVQLRALAHIVESLVEGSSRGGLCLLDRVILQAERDIEYTRANFTGKNTENSSKSDFGIINATDIVSEPPELGALNEALSANTNATSDPVSLVYSAANVCLSDYSVSEKRKFIRKRVLNTFGGHVSDVGSARVQVAVMSLKIRDLANHLYKMPQDTRTRVFLDELIQRRRKIFGHLRRDPQQKTEMQTPNSVPSTTTPRFQVYMDTVRDLGLKFA